MTKLSCEIILEMLNENKEARNEDEATKTWNKLNELSNNKDDKATWQKLFVEKYKETYGKDCGFTDNTDFKQQFLEYFAQKPYKTFGIH